MERSGGWGGAIGKALSRVMPGKRTEKKETFRSVSVHSGERGFTALPADDRALSDDDDDLMGSRAMTTDSMMSTASSRPRTRVNAFNKEQRDKLYSKMHAWETGYTIGFFRLLLDVVSLLRFPQYYWLWHVVKAGIFLPSIYSRFVALNDEFYMLDFCYFNAYYTIGTSIVVLVRYWFGVGTSLYKYNAELFRVGFVLANGPLVLSVPIFGNKIVFHDMANASSIFIHFSPAVMFWTLRWGGGFGVGLIEKSWPGSFKICGDMTGESQFQDVASYFWSGNDSCTFTPMQLVVWPALMWLCTWALPYYLVVLHCLEGYLKRNNKTTLYLQAIREPNGSGWFTKKAPAWLWKECFILLHGGFTLGTGATLGYLLWNSFVLHSIFLLGVFAHAFHNGSKYIFRVVAARHVHDAIEDQLDAEETEDPCYDRA